EGAELITGGQKLAGDLANGYFLEPTIFAHKNDQLQIVQEEIFGPVVAVSSFDSFDEVVDRANDTPYGLAAAVWTKDISKAHKFAHATKAGTVWINSYDLFDPAVPFGGFKESGIGKEMGKSALDLYTKEKAIWVAL
ncbi:MAG: aldehyde dehydrogenase family protein, partial [Bacteroidota bacterium]